MTPMGRLEYADCNMVSELRASTIRVSQQAITLAMSSKSWVEEKEVRRERRAGS
jgi:hypothetical protein